MALEMSQYDLFLSQYELFLFPCWTFLILVKCSEKSLQVYTGIAIYSINYKTTNCWEQRNNGEVNL